MDEFFSGWFGQLAATAGLVLTLAGIFGLGFRVGVRERHRELEKELVQIDTLLVASRREVETYRSQSILWENRFKEAEHPNISESDGKVESVRRLTVAHFG